MPSFRCAREGEEEDKRCWDPTLGRDSRRSAETRERVIAGGLPSEEESLEVGQATLFPVFEYSILHVCLSDPLVFPNSVAALSIAFPCWWWQTTLFPTLTDADSLPASARLQPHSLPALPFQFVAPSPALQPAGVPLSSGDLLLFAPLP
jgi:hypothetical protein